MKINLKKFLFYFGYIMIVASYMFEHVNFFKNYIDVFNYIGIFTLLLLSLFLFISKKVYTMKNILAIFILAFILAISYMQNKSFLIIKLFLIIYTAQSFEFSDFIKNDIKIKSTFIILVLILYFLGETDKIVVVSSYIRYSFGFGHPNTIGIFISTIILELFYLYRKNKFIIYVVSIILLLFNYIFLKSRSSIILVLIFLILYVLSNKNEKLLNNKYIKFLITNLPLILFILSFSTILLYSSGSNFINYLDELFSYRIRWMYNYYNLYKINLWGNNVLTYPVQTYINGNWYFTVDNAYIHYILSFGIIITILSYFWIKKIFKFAYDNKNYLFIIILISYLIYGLSESAMYNFIFNPFLIYFSVLFKKKEGTK